MKILHPKKDKADIRYLYYLMQTLELNHVTHKRYWISEYSEIEIPLPSLSDQKKVVKKIEELFAKIDEAQKLREESKKETSNLLQSALNEVFVTKKWPLKKLEDISFQTKYSVTGKKDLPYVGMEDIESNTGRFIGSLDPREVKSTTFAFSPGNILYGKLRPYLNKVILVDFEGRSSTELVPFSAMIQYVTKEWLAWWFLSPETVDKAMRTSTGTRMPRANLHEVRKFKLPVPPIAEQKKIVARLDLLSAKIRELQQLQSETEKDLKELKQSILKKAFAGELI